MWKRNNKSMVGVDIGSSSVKAVELQGKAARRGGLSAPLVLILGPFVVALAIVGRLTVDGR